MTQPTSYFLARRAKWRLTLPNARAQGDMAPRSAQAQHLWGKPRPSLQQVPGLRWRWASGNAHGSVFPAEPGQLRGVGPGRPRPASSRAAWVTVEAARCHCQASCRGPRPRAGRHQARGRRRQKRTPGVGGLVGAKGSSSRMSFRVSAPGLIPAGCVRTEPEGRAGSSHYSSPSRVSVSFSSSTCCFCCWILA